MRLLSFCMPDSCYNHIMDNDLEKIIILEQRIKVLEARVNLAKKNSDFEIHIKRLKERKHQLEDEYRKSSTVKKDFSIE